jgi:epoxyqueuosine reductase
MNDGPANRAAHVKARAAELGFELVGIASTEPFDADFHRTLAWIERGLHGTMGWITPERTRTACAPAELLPGAQSIVVVGASYSGPDDAPSDDLSRGRVARYARGMDYHDVMKARLATLAQEVRSVGPEGTRTRIFVDSSPLPERAAAVRAGLGFVGKNTNLLTARVGSWVLLGALVTDLALAPDPPLDRDCGRCRLCLDACPTDAFPEPYVVDATRCISYLTIELRGPIPHELRPMLGDRVFGCDVCQDVCPWNRATRPAGWPELIGPPEAALPPLADLLALDDEAFRARYRHTPLWRTKRRGLLRNAAVALGNVGTIADLPALARALSDPEPLVRGHAAWAIGQIGAAAGAALLRGARADESDGSVLDEIDAALAMLGPDSPDPGRASPPTPGGSGSAAM